MKFKVEGTFTVDGKACVIARRGGAGDFSLSGSSKLDGVPVLERLEVPPKLQRRELGLDRNVFAFVLADPAALLRFRKYDVVELTP
jgi:hypothetical protein